MARVFLTFGVVLVVVAGLSLKATAPAFGILLVPAAMAVAWVALRNSGRRRRRGALTVEFSLEPVAGLGHGDAGRACGGGSGGFDAPGGCDGGDGGGD